MGVGAKKYPLKVEYARCDTQTLEVGEFSEIRRDETLNFLESDVWYPGYSAFFELKITNEGSDTIFINSVGFCAPTEDEESARVVDQTSYYLGTQLSAAVLAINQTPQATPTEQRLLTLNEGTPNRVELIIYEEEGQGVTLQSSESIQLTVRLRFVNENVSQDVYQNFGKDPNATEYCQRRLFVNYELAE